MLLGRTRRESVKLSFALVQGLNSLSPSVLIDSTKPKALPSSLLLSLVSSFHSPPQTHPGAESHLHPHPHPPPTSPPTPPIHFTSTPTSFLITRQSSLTMRFSRNVAFGLFSVALMGLGSPVFADEIDDALGNDAAAASASTTAVSDKPTFTVSFTRPFARGRCLYIITARHPVRPLRPRRHALPTPRRPGE